MGATDTLLDKRRRLQDFLDNISEQKVLSNLTLNTLSHTVFRVEKPTTLSTVFSAIIVALGLFALTTIAQVTIESPPFTLSLVFLIACGLGAFSLLVVKVAYHLTVPVIAQNLPKILTDESQLDVILKWLKGIFNIKAQVLVSFACSIVVVVLALLFYPSDVLVGHSPVVFAIVIGLTIFPTGQGIYWGYYFPFLWKMAGDSEVKLNRLNPHTTPELKALSMASNTLVFAISIVATGYLTWLFLVMAPFKAQTSTASSIGLTIAIIGLITYGFVAPQIYLAKAIRKQKAQTVQDIERRICEILDQQDESKKIDTESLNALFELQQKVASSKSNVISLRNLESYFASIVLPVLSYLIGGFDLDSIIDLLS